MRNTSRSRRLGGLAGLALSGISLSGISVSAVFLAGLAVASTLPAAAQQTAPAATSQPVTSQPSVAQLAAARELIIASGLSRSISIVIPQYMDQIGTNLTQTRPELIRDLNVVLTNLQPEFEKQADDMIDSAARIYAGLLSEQDLKAAVAFFDSDAGRKYVNAQPAFLGALSAPMRIWQQTISNNMMTRVRTEMRKKGHEL